MCLYSYKICNCLKTEILTGSICFYDSCLTEKAEIGTSSDITKEKNCETVKILYYCMTGLTGSLLNTNNPSN